MPERPVPPHDHTRFSRGGKLSSAAITGLTTSTTGTAGGDGGSSSGGVSDHGGLSGLGDDDHTQYRLDASWFDVTRYGATGDGSTDDTTSVNSAIAALVAAGGGTLYFPEGNYKITAALTSLTVTATVAGDGHASSKITCTSATAVLFTVAASEVHLRDLWLHNSATASAGAAVRTTTNGHVNRYTNLLITSFWVGLDIQAGIGWVASGCWIESVKKYGIKVSGADADWGITDCLVSDAAASSADAAIRIESSGDGGGGKILNLKVNGTAATGYNHGIDLAVPGSTNTVDLLISNCSLENTRSAPIEGTTSAGTSKYGQIIITGCEFGYNVAGHAINLVATTLGDFYNVIIGPNSYDATIATSAVHLTNVDIARVYGGVLHGSWTSLFTTTTCTNVVDASGAVGAAVTITGTPGVGDVPTATSTTAATWQAPAGGTFATPAIVLGTAAAAGAASTVIRSDSTVVAFDATVPVTQASADAAATGSVAYAARRDHRHGMPTLTPGIGEIVINDTHSTPLIFADLVQTEAEDDLVYSDP